MFTEIIKPDTHIDFLRHWKVCAALSVCVILAGLIAAIAAALLRPSSSSAARTTPRARSSPLAAPGATTDRRTQLSQTHRMEDYTREKIELWTTPVLSENERSSISGMMPSFCRASS